MIIYSLSYIFFRFTQMYSNIRFIVILQFIVKRIATMPNVTTIEKKGNETDQEKLNIRRIISGAEVYYNFTGEAKCLDLANEDEIGAAMWDYQVEI